MDTWLVYPGSPDYDLVVYLFVDVSRDKKILRSLGHDVDQQFKTWNDWEWDWA